MSVHDHQAVVAQLGDTYGLMAVAGYGLVPEFMELDGDRVIRERFRVADRATIIAALATPWSPDHMWRVINGVATEMVSGVFALGCGGTDASCEAVQVDAFARACLARLLPESEERSETRGTCP